MSVGADSDTDAYELGLRRKDARRSLLIGVVLLVVAGVVLLGFGAQFLLAKASLEAGNEARFSIWPLACVGILAALGGGGIKQGFAKHAAANRYEVELKRRRHPSMAPGPEALER